MAADSSYRAVIPTEVVRTGEYPVCDQIKTLIPALAPLGNFEALSVCVYTYELTARNIPTRSGLPDQCRFI